MAGGPQGNEFLSVPLTNFAIGVMERMPSLPRQLLPKVPVDQQTGPYYKVPRGEWFRNRAKPLARASESAGSGWTLSSDTYSVAPRAYHKDNDDQDYLNASVQRVLNLDQAATRFVSDAILISEDQRFADAFMPDAGNIWDYEVTGDASPSGAQFLFWDDTDATPVNDVKTAALSIAQATGGRKPNTMVVPPAVHQVLTEHPSIIARFQYSQPGIIAEPELARLFMVENYVVAWSVINDAAEGAVDDMQFTLGQNVLLAYFDIAAGPENQTAGALFTWTGMDGGQGVRIDRYRVPEKHIQRIEGFDAVDMKVTDTSAGALFLDCLSS